MVHNQVRGRCATVNNIMGRPKGSKNKPKEVPRERRDDNRISDLFRAVDNVTKKLDGVASVEDAYCDPVNGGCNHALTAHSRGLIIHDRCLITGCHCKRAVLTAIARDRVKKGIVA